MNQPARQAAVTHRDGESPRMVAQFRDEAVTRVLPLPRRKRYFTPLDLDTIAPPDAEHRLKCGRPAAAGAPTPGAAAVGTAGTQEVIIRPCSAIRGGGFLGPFTGGPSREVQRRRTAQHPIRRPSCEGECAPWGDEQSGCS